MGQSQSHLEKPIGLWHRRKKKATRSQLPPGSAVQSSLPTRGAHASPAQTGQPATNACQAPTTATATAISTPPVEMKGDTMVHANASVGKASEAGKAVEPPNGLQEQSTVSDSGVPDKPDKLNDIDGPKKPKERGPVAENTTLCRPALKREYTPPHRIRMDTYEAWQTNRIFRNVHQHITGTLNSIRHQQNAFRLPFPSASALMRDVYKAADSCTLSLEYLVGNFSTKFFHYDGPENIRAMMAVIEADATALDSLRRKQLKVPSYSSSLVGTILDTENHIRELGDLAKRIREEPFEEAEDGEADADWEPDP